jgi:hypothetical protein
LLGASAIGIFPSSSSSKVPERVLAIIALVIGVSGTLKDGLLAVTTSLSLDETFVVNNMGTLLSTAAVVVVTVVATICGLEGARRGSSDFSARSKMSAASSPTNRIREAFGVIPFFN